MKILLYIPGIFEDIIIIIIFSLSISIAEQSKKKATRENFLFQKEKLSFLSFFYLLVLLQDSFAEIISFSKEIMELWFLFFTLLISLFVSLLPFCNGKFCLLFLTRKYEKDYSSTVHNIHIEMMMFLKEFIFFSSSSVGVGWKSFFVTFMGF